MSAFRLIGHEWPIESPIPERSNHRDIATPDAVRTSRSRLLPASLITVWMVAACAGLFALFRYETRDGVAASPPGNWPSSSRLYRTSGRATLVIFLHPHCPCSRASIEELDRLLAYVHGLVTVHAVFLKPREVSSDWEVTDLWERAASIPDVHLTADDEGIEAGFFDAATSGQVVLYDAEDRLIFSGGITASRGNSGDNDGRETIRALLTGDRVRLRDRTPVFGCSLRDASIESSRGSMDVR